eukprot:CAMPEP_0195058902 /NCGR_PEP_ID=MMETSP0448-20130528/6543_1 /TAXON_ID=66468 /ORGANISM="Heterocapsa triquestra, Strain CCMP 448" /LENGTH=454 /DNA_ID=CAMNT_0040089087 /DNA_START=90 /DNA_END=1454 /DNA_ORIENTATION=-
MAAAGSLRAKALKGSAVLGGGAVAAAYYSRIPSDQTSLGATWSEGILGRCYRSFAAPIVFQTDPEFAHSATLYAGRAYQALRLLGEPSWTGASPVDWLLRPNSSAVPDSGPKLNQELFGGKLAFATPFGIAAGFDKNAVLVPMYRIHAIPGLGFSEIGSVSALPSAGNPKPRCFRLVKDQAVINRMGLGNEGSEAIAERLKSFTDLGSATSPPASGQPRAPVGVNIAKTHSPDIMGDAAVEDFVTSYERTAAYADFVVINVSCPNTAEGKTFEDREALSGLLRRIGEVRSRMQSKAPVLVKLSPPLDTPEGRGRLGEMVQVAQASGIVDGYVITNTVGDRDIKLSEEGVEQAAEAGKGGLSGKPIRARSTAAVREVYRLTGGSVPIIGLGGVDSAETAYEKIRAGASLVEVYTGIIYKGPTLFSDMQVGLRRLLERDGFSSVSEAVGADVRGKA